MRPLLVLHNDPDEVRGVLEARLPGVPVAYATRADEVHPALDACDPECVFSVKHDGFPGPGHRPILEHPSVRWIHVGGSGFEHLQPWDARRLTLTNCAGVLAPYLAETVTGAILALNGHFLRYAARREARRWEREPFVPLGDRTLLVVGLGHIGALVARNARALGMTVLAVRRSPAPHPHAHEVHPPGALAELLGRADFVSLHLRLDETTRGFFDAERIAAMRPGSFLVNTSRGPVVDEAALIAALEHGHLAGAYLDVFETEPLPRSGPLWSTPGVLLTPHTSDNVVGWPARFAELFVDNLERWRTGEPLVNVIAP